MKKCTKCDERGMISNGDGSAHSCECGYDNFLMQKAFEGVTLEQLLAYGFSRRQEKERQMQFGK